MVASSSRKPGFNGTSDHSKRSHKNLNFSNYNMSYDHNSANLDVNIEQIRKQRAEEEEEILNDYSQYRAYNMDPTVVPPYVLDSIAKSNKHSRNSTLRDFHKNLDSKESEVHPLKVPRTIPDMFLSSLNNDWNSFLDTIESKSANLVQPSILPIYENQNLNNLKRNNSLSGHNRRISSLSKNELSFNNRSSLTLNKNSESDISDMKIPDLSGYWEGDKRLREVLNKDDLYLGSSDTTGKMKFSIFSSIFSKATCSLNHINNSVSNNSNKDHDPKVMSKYWLSSSQRSHWKSIFQTILLFNPYLLLVLRSFTFIFSAVALALACAIFKNTNKIKENVVAQQPSTIMAITVETIAMVYLVYITWDEYSGKPLGLRNPMDKIKLVSLDLLFIIFSSANIALAFNTMLDDRWFCVSSSVGEALTKRDTGVAVDALKNSLYQIVTRAAVFIDFTVMSVCDKQKALCAFLFITLCLWVITFSISIFRIIDRVSSSPKS